MSRRHENKRQRNPFNKKNAMNQCVRPDNCPQKRRNFHITTSNKRPPDWSHYLKLVTSNNVMNIPTRITRRPFIKNTIRKAASNRVIIPLQTRVRNQDQKSIRLPTFLLINARSLVPKISVFLDVDNIDIAAVTETWFRKDIDDERVTLAGYCLHRRDRVKNRDGGVCLYVSNSVHSKRLLDLENTHHECMWIWLRQNRLPRPLTSIVACVVYNPPDRDAHEQRELNEYISCSIDLHFPLEQVTFHESDKPWVTPYIKSLVKKRQKAFHSGNAEQWKSL